MKSTQNSTLTLFTFIQTGTVSQVSKLQASSRTPWRCHQTWRPELSRLYRHSKLNKFWIFALTSHSNIGQFNFTRNVKNDPSGIQHWDSNSQPLGHQSPPITTRPRASTFLFYKLCVKLVFARILLASISYPLCGKALLMTFYYSASLPMVHRCSFCVFQMIWPNQFF